MEITWIIQFLLGAIMTGLGFWNKSMLKDIQSVREQLARTREEYVHKSDLRELKSELAHRFDKLEELIRDKKE